MVSITHLLNRACSIRRSSTVSNGQGGLSTSFAEVSAPKGRRVPASESERSLAGRQEAVVTHVWYFDKGVDVRNRDVLYSAGGITDEVVGSLPPSSPDFVKVTVKEIQLGSTN
jgi:hypothetical protein